MSKRNRNPNKNFSRNPGFLPSGDPVPSSQLVPIVRDTVGNKIILSFSGKDSLAMWLYLRDQGFEVVPYFCYTIPGLSFDDEFIDYYERFFGQKIYKLPHPLLYLMLSRFSFQTLDSALAISSMKISAYEWDDVEFLIANDQGMNIENYYSAVGIRAADNMMRNRLVHQMGPLGLKKRRYYWAVWDWKIADVREYIKKNNAPLPEHYVIWGSTGDSIDYTAIKYIKDSYPTDYQKFLNYFPLLEVETFRYEKVR